MKGDRERLMVAVVRSVLSDDLRARAFKGNANAEAGHCYAASEALYHLLGGKKAGYKPMCFTMPTGMNKQLTHWFIQGPDGTALDPTSSQCYPVFGLLSEFIHIRAVGKGFLTKKPSARAREILRRVERAL
jgi:hypothetical protein